MCIEKTIEQALKLAREGMSSEPLQNASVEEAMKQLADHIDGLSCCLTFSTLKALQGKGHRLILWTFRHGRLLDEAVSYCRENGIEFYAVNENFPGETLEGYYSRKLNANIFIDDRNVGGFPGWDVIWATLHPENIGDLPQAKRDRGLYRILERLFSR